MQGQLKAVDWIRILIGFGLGVAVTLMVLQITSKGELLQGLLIPDRSFSTSTSIAVPTTVVPTTTVKIETDTVLGDSLERLPSGTRIESAEDDDAGLNITTTDRLEKEDVELIKLDDD